MKDAAYWRDYRERKRKASLKPCRLAASFVSMDTRIPHEITRVVVKSFVKFITQELQSGRSIRIENLGVFKLTHRKGRSHPWPEMKKVGKRFIKTGKMGVREFPSADYPLFTASPVLRKTIWEVRKPVYREFVR